MTVRLDVCEREAAEWGEMGTRKPAERGRDRKRQKQRQQEKLGANETHACELGNTEERSRAKYRANAVIRAQLKACHLFCFNCALFLSFKK